MKLIKYRDAGMHTYTFFYVNEKENNRLSSPFFDSEDEAISWIHKKESQLTNKKEAHTTITKESDTTIPKETHTASKKEAHTTSKKQ